MDSGIHVPMNRPSPAIRPLPWSKVKNVRDSFSTAPQFSHRPLPVRRSSTQTQAMEKMLKLAAEYPEYRANAAKVKLVDTTAGEYYGKGYQDVSNRVPKIENTRQELGWEPKVSMRDALKQIFEAYKGQISQASHLLD